MLPRDLVQDAHNLAWKLAAVHHGIASPDLLLTYGQGVVLPVLLELSRALVEVTGFKNRLRHDPKPLVNLTCWRHDKRPLVSRFALGFQDSWALQVSWKLFLKCADSLLPLFDVT